MQNKIFEKRINEPIELGSYKREDVVFLLKDISYHIEEKATEDREEIIQGGGHYSEMLPIEYKPSDEYLSFYRESMEIFAKKVALGIENIADRIYKDSGKDVVLVSLARAGTPFGILIKRYLKIKYGVNLSHYSISIIRGKGIDENALIYIIRNSGTNLQFVDGWTGKGTIIRVLNKALDSFKEKYGYDFKRDIAVVADPGGFTPLCGTREDLLIPSACLNSTISGLISRTVLRDDLIGEADFHGVKYYRELQEEDLSNEFLDKITEKFDFDTKVDLNFEDQGREGITTNGLSDIEKIKRDFEVEDINFIKPGIGETTRVLLRRVPWKVLINPKKNMDLDHILILAKEKGVDVVEYEMDSYQCCGIIKSLKE